MEKIIVKVPCYFCGGNMEIPMTEKEAKAVEEWKIHRHDSDYDKHIQDILPIWKFTPEQREIFISGMCDKCWDKIFGSFEDEDDE